jgi:hypothetical protein
VGNRKPQSTIATSDNEQITRIAQNSLASSVLQRNVSRLDPDIPQQPEKTAPVVISLPGIGIVEERSSHRGLSKAQVQRGRAKVTTVYLARTDVCGASGKFQFAVNRPEAR